ncbi:MAG: hypothetical protein NEHIOOID_00272 [Holosporales bacterium]
MMIPLNHVKYLSWHRGMKEMDLILGRFFDAVYLILTQEDQDSYIKLLQEDDWLLYHWIIDQSSNVDPFYQDVVKRIRAFHGIGKTI